MQLADDRRHNMNKTKQNNSITILFHQRYEMVVKTTVIWQLNDYKQLLLYPHEHTVARNAA